MASGNTPRGAFILFEGIDRCGKTTQSGLLAAYAASKGKCESIRFPNRTSQIGKLINDYLLSTAETSNVSDQTIHLLFSANRWEAAKDIERKLQEGVTLICDRYAYSGVSFSAAKGVPGMDLDWCRACDRGLPSPDCVIYLDMPVEDAARRGEFGAERYEKIDFQVQVRKQFMQMKAHDEEKGLVPWHTIDARQSIEQIQKAIQDIADETMGRVGSTDIRRLFQE
jgi:dTMP kinase